MAEELLEWDMRRHEALKAGLSGQSVSVLVELLMESARNDDTVRVVLRCLTERESAGQADGDPLREATRFLTCLPQPGKDPTCRSDRIEHRLNWMLFLLGATLNGKNPEGLVEAVELALEGSEILAMADLDSEYWSDSVREELVRLHRLACERTQPDAVALAVRWARIRGKSKLRWYEDFPEKYVDFLGAEGLAAHELALRNPAS